MCISLFKTESESETDVSTITSEYIQTCWDVKYRTTVLGRSKFNNNFNYVFVYGRNYKATQGLGELLIKFKPDKNAFTIQDRQAYTQTLFQSNAYRVNYSPTGKIKANKGLKYKRLISHIFTDKI